MAIGSGVLLSGVAENPTFPILSALAYTTGLGYRPTCDDLFPSRRRKQRQGVWSLILSLMYMTVTSATTRKL